MSDITVLSYEKIDNDFCKAKYGDFDVIMMLKNGYINATKLCSKGDKRYENWYQTKGNKELIQCANQGSKQPITIPIKKGPQYHHINGTFVHPKLIPHIASWISPQFAMKVSEIVTNYLIKEKEEQIKQKNEIIKKQELELKADKVTIGEKDTEITDLRQMMREMREILNAQNEKLDMMTESLEESHDKLDLSNEKLDIQTEITESIAKKLKIAVEDRVLKSKYKDKIELCALIKNFDDNKRPDNEASTRQYKVMRVQMANYERAMTKQKKIYPNAKEIYRIDCTPNSVSLFHTIKDTWNGRKIQTYMTSFDLIGNTTIQMVIDLMNRKHAERLNVEDN